MSQPLTATGLRALQHVMEMLGEQYTGVIRLDCHRGGVRRILHETVVDLTEEPTNGYAKFPLDMELESPVS